MATEPRILITGVSGYTASWLAYAALKLGYRVRGTVRSLAESPRLDYLRNLCPGSKHELELVEVNLLADEGWNEAVRGCQYIIHLAGPFSTAEPRDPNELLVPYVEGTLRVLRAAAALEVLPRRVIITSSIAAISFGHTKKDYSDDDWSDIENPKIPALSYARAKTIAEKSAWKFVEELPIDRRFEMVSIAPSMILGPMLSSNPYCSGEVVAKILLAQYPALPDVRFACVSVFDVVRAHLLAMTHPAAAGKRFVVSAKSSGLQDYAKIINKEFRQYGYSPLSMHAPNYVLRVLAAAGDRDAIGSVPFLGKIDQFHCQNARTILGLTFSEEFDLVKEMTHSMIACGLIPDKSKNRILSQSYSRPEFDISMIPAPEADVEDI